MKRLFMLTVSLFSYHFCAGQNLDADESRDRKYLEDQFYVGLTYNFMMNLPTDVSQRNLSYGLQAGFIKDIPMNYTRTIALGIGVGYGINSYYTNMLATQNGDDVEYTLLDGDSDFKRNKIGTHVLEVPFQFRWRNSSPEEYKFWRIYTGAKMGYVMDGHSKFVSSSDKIIFTNKDIKQFQYGLTLNVGYNTFNIHIYYALSSLLKEGTIGQSGEAIKIRPLKVGLIFYIL